MKKKLCDDYHYYQMCKKMRVNLKRQILLIRININGANGLKGDQYAVYDLFIWTSEKKGYNHIFLKGLDGSEEQITSGSWEVTSFHGLDSDKMQILLLKLQIIQNRSLFYIQYAYPIKMN